MRNTKKRLALVIALIGRRTRKFRMIAVLICLMFVLSFIVIPLASADAPALIWESNLNYPANIQYSVNNWSSPSIVDGVVYINSESTMVLSASVGYSFGDVYALNATNGAEVWDYRDNSSGSYDSPAIDNGALFFGSTSSSDNYFGALNATNGLSLWNYTLVGEGWEILSSPVVANGVVYIGAFNGLSGGLYALNETNGDEIWNFPTYAGVDSTPVVVNGVVYVASRLDNNLYALEATNGNRLWNYTTSGDVLSSPSVVDGVVYIGSGSDNLDGNAAGNLYALNAAYGEKLWNYSTAGSVSLPVVNEGIVYVWSAGSIYALEATNGAPIWNSTLGEGTNYSGPIVANGVVYVGSNQAGINGFNAYNGEELWNLPISAPYSEVPFTPSPAVTDDVMYFGSGDGQVYAYSVSSIPSPSPTVSTALSPSPTPSPATVPATTSNGATVDLAISGNITSSQMSNATIATNQSANTTTVSFTVTGESGTTGFGNITIPISAVPYGTTPTIYIDGQPAQTQGYTQDSNNYYVWYTTTSAHTKYQSYSQQPHRLLQLLPFQSFQP